jgi:predicted metalloprotease
MRWRGLRRSENYESRGGGGRGALIGGGGIGVLVVAGIVYLLGGDPTMVLNQLQTEPGGETTAPTASNDPRLDFSLRILGSTEDVWGAVFRAAGGQYRPTRLVEYQGGTETACGFGQAAMGPFYCPNDGNVYLDMTFYDELQRRLGGGGDFAQAYVIAHEVGHHVQDLTGEMNRARQMGMRGEESGGVRLELQADCYAGVWAARANRDMEQRTGSPLIEPGDLEQGLRTASAIGDDTLQQASGRGVSPETFTHGTSEQRARWLRRGLERGDPAACDTFSGRAL